VERLLLVELLLVVVPVQPVMLVVELPLQPLLLHLQLLLLVVELLLTTAVFDRFNIVYCIIIYKQFH